MTPFDLKISFKMDTGEYPTWGSYELPYSGKPKSLYGLWIEEKLGNYEELRFQFKQEIGKTPVFKSYSVNDWLYSGYIEWLEEKYCAKN